MTTGSIVAIACGNTLRGDDGVAWHIGLAIEEQPLFAAVNVIFAQQLLPEHAELLRDTELALFLDCSAVSEAGSVSIIPLEPAAHLPRILTHHLDPSSLLRLTLELYGNTPPAAFVITVGGASFGLGEPLTPLVEAAVPIAVEAVRHVLPDAQPVAGAQPSIAIGDI